jgi:hypothetical protein
MKVDSIIIAIVIILIWTGCKPEKEYEQVSEQDAIELIKNQQINFFNLSYADKFGNPMTDSLRQLLNQGKVVRHFYKNKSGEINQVRLIEANDENIFYEIRIRDLQQNPFSDIAYVQINCDSSKQILKRTLDRDQNARKGILDNIQEVDKVNRDTIVSLLDKCMWPKSKEDIESIWYVIQHSGTGKMSYYYPKFKEMVRLDLLEDSLMAKMEDRMLMFNGYPQIYGTQFTGEPRTFHEIKDIHNVNERRRKVGLCSIEQKAKSAGIYFDWADYERSEN